MLHANASKSKERNSPLPQTMSPCWKTEAGTLRMILNRTILLTFLLGNSVNRKMHNKCSSAVFICLFFSFFFFQKPLNQSLWGPFWLGQLVQTLKFVILEYKWTLLLRTFPLSHSFPPLPCINSLSLAAHESIQQPSSDSPLCPRCSALKIFVKVEWQSWVTKY